MDLGEALLLKDAKIALKKVIDPKMESNNSFELLMQSYDYFLNRANASERDYENREFAKMIYSELGWDDVNGSYDVINSFYGIFKCALVYTDVFNENDNISTAYRFGEKGQFEYRTCYGYTRIGKKKHVRKILGKDYTCHKAVQKFIREDKNGKDIVQFSSLCHCVANFMPCPDRNFNEAKGCLNDVRDYLPLMVDKIQECIDTKSNLEYVSDKQNKFIPNSKLNDWHNWLVENREKYCLEPYYYIKKENDETRIIGIPIFKAQSLKNPVPKSKGEVDECINEIIKRIRCRANLIVHKYQDFKVNVG